MGKFGQIRGVPVDDFSFPPGASADPWMSQPKKVLGIIPPGRDIDRAFRKAGPIIGQAIVELPYSYLMGVLRGKQWSNRDQDINHGTVKYGTLIVNHNGMACCRRGVDV